MAGFSQRSGSLAAAIRSTTDCRSRSSVTRAASLAKWSGFGRKCMVASSSMGRVDAGAAEDADADADAGAEPFEFVWCATAAAAVSGASGEASESTGSSRREVELMKAARQRCASRMHGA